MQVDRVGVIGVGNMGLGIALRLREQGHAVTVRDIDPAREAMARQAGCGVAATPARLAEASDLTIVVVVDAEQTHDVVFARDGAARALAPGKALMLCPTIAPSDVEAVAASLAPVGIDVIDAPMSGGPTRARLGTMSLMVAASAAAFERWRPVMDRMAGTVTRVGSRPGDGARTKLVNNLLAAVNLVGAAEALALAERLGLDLSTTLDVIESSSGQSWIGVDRMRRALAGRTEVLAQVSLLAKDSALAMDEARRCGAQAEIGKAAAAAFARASGEGLGERDDSVLLEWAAGSARGADSPQPPATAPPRVR